MMWFSEGILSIDGLLCIINNDESDFYICNYYSSTCHMGWYTLELEDCYISMF